MLFLGTGTGLPIYSLGVITVQQSRASSMTESWHAELSDGVRRNVYRVTPKAQKRGRL